MRTVEVAPRRDRPALTGRQRAAVVAPLLLMGMMYPIFLALDAAFGDYLDGYLGWYLGLATYWIFWGGFIAVRMIGRSRARELLRPRRPTIQILLLIALPVVMAGAVRLLPGMGYEKHTIGVLLLVLSTTVGNGFFEELFWRGVYLELFRQRFFFRVVWPSVWFGLWHLIPVSVSNGESLLPMVMGPLFFGFYLAFLARRTDSVWWPFVTHLVGGLVMIS